MPRLAPDTSRLARALRVALVVAVLAGYLAALGGTASGQGWKLASHLARDHASPTLAAPILHEEGSGDHTLTTLTAGERHTHGGRAHTHGLAEAGHGSLADLFSEHRQPDSHQPGASGVHEHDGVLHSHDAPPPEPTAVVTVSLDKHRLPGTPAVPAPPAPGLADREAGLEPPRSVDRSVETPPPIWRG